MYLFLPSPLSVIRSVTISRKKKKNKYLKKLIIYNHWVILHSQNGNQSVLSDWIRFCFFCWCAFFSSIIFWCVIEKYSDRVQCTIGFFYKKKSVTVPFQAHRFVGDHLVGAQAKVNESVNLQSAMLNGNLFNQIEFLSSIVVTKTFDWIGKSEWYGFWLTAGHISLGWTIRQRTMYTW